MSRDRPTKQQRLHLENGRFGWKREGGGGCVSSEKAEQMLKREKLGLVVGTLTEQ
jgi:hypothetical protein